VNPPADGRHDSRRRPLDLQLRSTLAGEAAAAAAEVESALDPGSDPTAAAFFDVDNTVMQGASIFHLAKGLHRRDFFTTREILGAAWKQAYFRIVGVEDPEHVAEARNSALSFIAGHTVKELEELGEEIFDEAMAHRIWPGTRALAQLHLDQGQRVWLVTAAPIEIASIIARRLGLTGAMGTVSEHVDGVYTGRLVGDLLHGPAKAEAIKALAAREGLDLARCSAYSDSFNDLPMLSLVGDACAINPDARLRHAARENGWRIRDYRTGRKAARAGLLVGAVAGGVSGAVAAGVALRGRRRRPSAGAWPNPRLYPRADPGVPFTDVVWTTFCPPTVPLATRARLP
jgi:HAD superfamily hydrolase (TIGR01490 family)